MTAKPLAQHNIEIEENSRSWDTKPLLRTIYANFHRQIASHIRANVNGKIVELGSGIGNIREVIPDCIRTDLFKNPWLDQTENAYQLSFAPQQVSHLILFDVFHHLQYPGTALREFHRVLAPGGRVIIFDPYISLFGWLVYGLLHHEPVAYHAPITWDAPASFDPWKHTYYAAQGNATRVFWEDAIGDKLEGWKLHAKSRFSALAYVFSGGYSKPQLYPSALYPLLQLLEKVADFAPFLLATRTLVVLEKR